MDVITQPFWAIQLACMLGLKSIFVLTHIWLLLIRTIIGFNVDLSWKVLVWTFAILSLPIRVLTALHKERLLQMYLYEMQQELENLAWEKKHLNEQLQITIKDCRIMGAIISELEEENDKAFVRIELLESELQDMKDENTRLTEMYEDSKWNLRGQDYGSYGNVVDTVKKDTSTADYDKSFWKTISNASDEIMDKLVHVDQHKDKAEPRSSFSPANIPKGLVVNEEFYQHKEVAMSQSIFSAVLSLLVGMIIWKAGDPCLPLVIALFIVVGMSLRSVVQFFFTIKNKPASDAVALLSFNWFILGTLTYPTLPIVARLLMPLVPGLAEIVM